jgi:putative transposase
MPTSFRRRHLPHYDVDHATYFITTCLAGSLPARGRLKDGSPQASPNCGQIGPHDALAMFDDPGLQADFASTEAWLDDRPLIRWLRDSRLAAIVLEELLSKAGAWYDLHAYVVMPSHVHWVCTPREQWMTEQQRAGRCARATLVRAIKGRTARACNRVLGRQGAFWQSESYDRVVRKSEELERFVQYVEYNPVKAGLCKRPEEWEFSSAACRTGFSITK